MAYQAIRTNLLARNVRIVRFKQNRIKYVNFIAIILAMWYY